MDLPNHVCRKNKAFHLPLEVWLQNADVCDERRQGMCCGVASVHFHPGGGCGPHVLLETRGCGHENRTIREPECRCHPHPPPLPPGPPSAPLPLLPPPRTLGTVPQRPCHRVLARTWAETAGEHTPGPQTPTVKREPFAPHSEKLETCCPGSNVVSWKEDALKGCVDQIWDMLFIGIVWRKYVYVQGCVCCRRLRAAATYPGGAIVLYYCVLLCSLAFRRGTAKVSLSFGSVFVCCCSFVGSHAAVRDQGLPLLSLLCVVCRLCWKSPGTVVISLAPSPRCKIELHLSVVVSLCRPLSSALNCLKELERERESEWESEKEREREDSKGESQNRATERMRSGEKREKEREGGQKERGNADASEISRCKCRCNMCKCEACRCTFAFVFTKYPSLRSCRENRKPYH